MKKNMQTRMVLTILVGLIASVTLNAAAKDAPADKPKPAIELGAPFGDNAVLQRQMKIPVWGWSKPGVKVTVQFAGQKKTAAAAKDGKWMLQLDKLKASFKPAEMVITDDAGKTVTLKNILVGEVWMASGQSNMQWKVTKSSCNKLKVEPVDGVAPMGLEAPGPVADRAAALERKIGNRLIHGRSVDRHSEHIKNILPAAEAGWPV